MSLERSSSSSAMKSSPRATRRHGETHPAPADSGVGIEVGGDQVVINLPHPRMLRVIARSVLLTAAILAFPWLRSVLTSAAADPALPASHRWADEPFLLPMLLRDLRREGLLLAGARGAAVFLGNPGSRLAFVKANKMIPVMSEAGRMAVLDRSVDFVLAADGFSDASFVFVERVLRIGGVIIVRLSSDPLYIFHLPENYRLVYIRQYGSTIVGMKKMAHAIARKNANAADLVTTQTGRKLLAVSGSKKILLYGLEDANAAYFIGTRMGRKLLSGPRSKKDAPNELEDALLELPDSESKASKRKRTRYLADLLGSLLNKYPRRVFVDVGLEPPDSEGKASKRKRTRYLADLLGSSLNKFPRREFVDVGLLGRASSEKWFEQQYPKGKSKFEINKLDVEGKGMDAAGTSGIAEWLVKNVKEEEYVVMKVEFEVAEEMVKERAAGLVDELFLECKNQWHKGRMGSRRAYWGCLALYGGLKDAGVAVHQWWV